MLKTVFWNKAAASLPEHVRARYISQLEQAERWELVIGGAVEVWARLKTAFRSSAPRAAH